MAFEGGNGNFGGENRTGNVWSAGSRGGSRGGYSRSNNDDDDDRREGRSYQGSYGNNNSRRGGYGFRRDNDGGQVEIQKDAIFIQNLPKDVTRDAIQDAFSTVGPIKTDEQSGGPKIWIYKDRITGESNGRATVTYEDEDTADKAISEYNNQNIDSLNAVVQVQLAQRRPRNNDRGGFGGGRGYRGGRGSWDNQGGRSNFDGDGNRWSSSSRGFSDNRSGGSGFRGRSDGGNSYRDGGDRDGSYRGSRGGSYRGASRGSSGASNYSPY